MSVIGWESFEGNGSLDPAKAKRKVQAG